MNNKVNFRVVLLFLLSCTSLYDIASLGIIEYFHTKTGMTAYIVYVTHYQKKVCKPVKLLDVKFDLGLGVFISV
jgi:hypothetical protein